MEFHTYRFETSEMRVIIRGWPISSVATKIKLELRSQALDIESVHQMRAQIGPKKALPLFPIKATRIQEDIYNVNRCLGLVVRVETVDRKQHRVSVTGVKVYYHQIRCEKNHTAREYDVSRSEKAKCVLCWLQYPLNYKG